ncbi:MAG: hypothetical protein MUW56_13185 [Chryseobacterium sp.]|uniref:hypothetical protein n=1 Tax=Chryseobacterium sp. TaxID=1871047 RepID=UPI0025BE8B75|nr:hypothetical protein [Chryseobacterium sp.]MCJ7934548.1 hypothetical protein [Chryseobacterium sp.]
MAIIKNAKNINIQVNNNYTSLSKVSHEESQQVIIEATKQNLQLSSQKKTLLQGFGKGGTIDDEETVDKVNGYYYNYNGAYEGRVAGEKKGNENDVYACNGKGTEKGIFLDINKLDISHDDFCWSAGIIKLESGANDYNELNCIANTASNRAKHKKTTLRILLEKGEPAGTNKYIPYSTVPKQNKKKLEDSDKTSYANNTR